MTSKLKRIFFLVLLGVFSTVASASQPLSGVAPDFTLKSNQGKNLRLEDFRGQVVMINFWASWCGPCRQEMPAMEEIYQQYQKLGFTILALTIDEDPGDADQFLESVPVSFPVLYDSESRISDLYGVDAMPTTVMIDRDGNKRFLHRSYQPGVEEAYKQQIKQLIRE